MAAYCTASFVPLVREMCDTYVRALDNPKLNKWLDGKLEGDGQTVQE